MVFGFLPFSLHLHKIEQITSSSIYYFYLMWLLYYNNFSFVRITHLLPLLFSSLSFVAFTVPGLLSTSLPLHVLQYNYIPKSNFTKLPLPVCSFNPYIKNSQAYWQISKWWVVLLTYFSCSLRLKPKVINLQKKCYLKITNIYKK